MKTNDTLKLLDECNSGIKMGIISIEQAMPKVKSDDLRGILEKSKREHQSLGSETHLLIDKVGGQTKEAPAMAVGMSWLKTTAECALSPGDDTVAELITDGCSMGVKSLNKYLNDYVNAKPESVEIAHKLINLEKKLALDVATFL